MNGTVTITNVSLRVIGENGLKEKNLRGLIQNTVKVLELGLRRIVKEKYGKDHRAMTMIGFLNESHCMVTTYPEDMIVELELGSCKPVSLSAFFAWLQSNTDYQIYSFFIQDKGTQGNWDRG